MGELTGYADRFSVSTGQQLNLRLHDTDGRIAHVDIVQLFHGDTAQPGPGLQEIVVDTSIGDLQLHPQETTAGSYMEVENADDLGPEDGLSIVMWIFATMPVSGNSQVLAARYGTNGDGYKLFIDDAGRVALELQSEDNSVRAIVDSPIKNHHWYFVAARIAPEMNMLEVAIYDGCGLKLRKQAFATAKLEFRIEAMPKGRLLLAALPLDGATSNHFNGKLADVRIIVASLSPEQLRELSDGSLPLQSPAPLAAWDFQLHQPGSDQKIPDFGNGKRCGLLFNCPTRAVTSYNWDGKQVKFTNAPSQYGAIHFHEDDVSDVRWKVSCSWTVPTGTPSGVYAARVSNGDEVDRIPFVVLPEPDSGASVLVVLPLFTYLAYANYLPHSYKPAPFPTDPHFTKVVAPADAKPDPPEETALRIHPEWGASCYDVHRDGSGVIFSSLLRPIPNLRPTYRFWLTDAPERLPADLYLLAWLRKLGIPCDVVTDLEVDTKGAELLQRYGVVLTGTHPEYTSANMIEAIETYLHQGGHLMYMGGNGFYWVTTVLSANPLIIEVRRGHNGTRTWESAPGEEFVSTTGEPGGLWRYRGNLPNRFLGVGFAAQSDGPDGAGYRRLHDSFKQESSFVFESVTSSDTIGDFGMVFGGAAGYEIDRIDYARGSPIETLVLASSQGLHSSTYELAVEDILMAGPGHNGEDESRVRADMVLVPFEAGGACFSVGSITWASSLSSNDYQNDVARISTNVLREFLRAES